MAAGLETEIDLYRRAADLRASADPSRPHDVCTRSNHHRAAVVERTEPAEHSGSHRGRPENPPRLYFFPRPQPGVGVLFTNRTTVAAEDRPHYRAVAGLSRRPQQS